jgi:hypothetical protein
MPRVDLFEHRGCAVYINDDVGPFTGSRKLTLMRGNFVMVMVAHVDEEHVRELVLALELFARQVVK